MTLIARRDAALRFSGTFEPHGTFGSELLTAGLNTGPDPKTWKESDARMTMVWRGLVSIRPNWSADRRSGRSTIGPRETNAPPPHARVPRPSTARSG